MIPVALHWLILHRVRDCQGMELYDIAESAKRGLHEVQRAILAMSEEHYSHEGAWLFIDRGRVYISGVLRDDASTGGWAAIESAAHNEQLLTDIQTWKDEALTGVKLDGKRSKIERAVLSTRTKEGGRKSDPDSVYFRAKVRLEKQAAIVDEPEVEGVRRCSTKGCLRELDTTNKVCRSCNRKRVRATRKKGK